MLVKITFPSLIAFLITFFCTPLVMRLASRFKLLDDPKKRKHPAHTHRGVIPRAGGLAIYLGILIPILFFLPLNKALIGIILGATLAVIVGLLDDKFDLNPYFRFFTNFGVALLVVASGIGIPFITNPFNGVIHLDTLKINFNFFGPHSILVLPDIFALLWIVWTMNIVSWSGGVEGQLPGFVSIAAFVIGLLSLRFSAHDISQITVATLSFITAFSFAGFLPWNFYPQKIMPGYGGKTLAGFLLSVLAILSGAKVGTALLVLGLPVTDALYTLTRRLASRKSPFWGDSGHLHHRLLEIGWGRKRIAIFYWLVSAILGVIALNLSSGGKFFAFFLLMILVGGTLLGLKIITTLKEVEN